MTLSEKCRMLLEVAKKDLTLEAAYDEYTSALDPTTVAEICSEYLQFSYTNKVQADRIQELEAANAELVEAAEFAQTAIDHALYLGYCGEGSTKGMCETASAKIEKALAKAGVK